MIHRLVTLSFILLTLAVLLNAQSTTNSQPTSSPTNGTSGPKLPCCNTCPEPKITINKIIIWKEVPIHIPFPVFKPYPQEPGDNGTCPNGYEKVDHNKCMRRITVGKNEPCPPGFIRMADDTCVRVIVLRTDPPIDQVICPPGMHRYGKIGCVKNNSTYVDQEIGTDIEHPIVCPPGYKRKGVLKCVKVVSCPKEGGWVQIKGLGCVPLTINCPPGFKRLGRNKCVKIEFKCPKGTRMNRSRTACVKVLPITYRCPPGYTRINGTKECVLTKCIGVKCPAPPTCRRGFHSRIPHGQCCPKCIRCSCDDTWNPVCGVDGATYINECHADCLKVVVKKRGKCGEPVPWICPPDFKPNKKCFRKCKTAKYEPVCSTEKVTYPNACYATCLGRTVASNGVCPKVQNKEPIPA